ncbi:MAG: preprotein translocase subunit SecY [Alphaproteobacteria bacterium]|nr:preprotein translocase subunit SecY [Alphaproteobacteria bacterium]
MSLSEKMASQMDFSAFSKASDLKKRLVFALIALIVFRLGTYIPLPGINPAVIKDFFATNSGGLLGMFNAFTGGALSRMSIFALNIMPYISASIIVQLSASVVPSLKALMKEGESGHRKMNQYTRYLTVLITIVQAFFMARALEAGGAVIMGSHGLFELSTVISLLGGTMFVVWLGDQITARGVGSGASVLIMVGIVAGMPGAVVRLFEEGRVGTLSPFVILFVLALIAAVVGVVVAFERAQRRIVIQYPKRQMGGRVMQGVNSHLPLKINPTGVMPPIFASAILAIPVALAQFYSKATDSDMLGRLMVWLTPGGVAYMAAFGLLIAFFTFFYTGLQPHSNPTEIADNLKKQGGFVAGIRPGQNTADYLDFVITRLTVLAAVYLVLLCILPEFIVSVLSVPIFFGGTTILIVVSVILDTVNQVQSHLVAHQYEALIRKAKLKGRL